MLNSGEARERGRWADGLVCREAEATRASGPRWTGMDGEGLADREEGGILNAEDDPFPMVPVLGS